MGQGQNYELKCKHIGNQVWHTISIIKIKWHWSQQDGCMDKQYMGLQIYM